MTQHSGVHDRPRGQVGMVRARCPRRVRAFRCMRVHPVGNEELSFLREHPQLRIHGEKPGRKLDERAHL